MTNTLLGTAVQFSLLLAHPSSGTIHPQVQAPCVSAGVVCSQGLELPTATAAAAGKSSLPDANPDKLANLRHRLLSSSLRVAALNKAATETLQARFAFHTLRYAIAMNNYFRVRHSRQDCTVQVAAWTTAIHAAHKANIKSYIKDIPPDCPLR